MIGRNAPAVVKQDDDAPHPIDLYVGGRMRLRRIQLGLSQGALAAKITMLQRTQELLDGCIGCGCLSLDRCALYDPNDRAARAGPGDGGYGFR